MNVRVAAVVLAALLLAAPAAAGSRPTLAQLEHEVMCPTCHTLLELSHAPIADRMRAFIRTRIAAGDTDSEIKARLVAEFGEGVLAAPPARGFGLLAWLLPILGCLGIGVGLAFAARRWMLTGRTAVRLAVAARTAEPIECELERALELELSRFDS